MTEVLKALGPFFFYAVVGVFAQNAVFTRALGVSRIVKLADDPEVDSLTFGVLLCSVQLISAPMASPALRRAVASRNCPNSIMVSSTAQDS